MLIWDELEKSFITLGPTPLVKFMWTFKECSIYIHKYDKHQIPNYYLIKQHDQTDINADLSQCVYTVCPSS